MKDLQKLVGKTIAQVEGTLSGEDLDETEGSLTFYFSDHTSLRIGDMCCCTDHEGLWLKFSDPRIDR